MQTKIKKQTNCRICKSPELSEFLNLGDQPLANAFRHPERRDSEEKFPLRVLLCRKCNLCQLGEVVDPEILFRDYIYYSSSQPVLPRHFKEYAEYVYNNFIHDEAELVVEMGSNDGLLLLAFKHMGARILGVDPAKNIAIVANERGVPTIAEFFGKSVAEKIKVGYGEAQVLIGNNVVAHTDDHHSLVSGIEHILSKDGVFVLEAPYLVDMFENMTFDTIYHEHMSYLAIRPLQYLFNQYSLEIFDVVLFPVQGQSIRVFVGRKGQYKVRDSVGRFINKELEMGLDRIETYKELARKIEKLKHDVVDTIKEIKKQGKIIAGYGAPAKGNTLLNYFDINNNHLEYLTESMPSKIGLYAPGTGIPVKNISDARKNWPDYFLLLAWSYKDAIIEKEREFRERGGKFILPIGKERIL